MKIIEIAKRKLGRGAHQSRRFRYFAVFNTPRRHAR